MNEENENKSVDKGIEVVGVSAVSPHNRALYEAGKALLIESITTGRQFCKFMISVSTGAIPIYLGLLKFVLPEHYTFSLGRGILVVGPAILFLIASVVFTVGYFPQVSRFSLDIPAEIERERKKTIQRRTKLTRLGFIIFLVATSGAITNIVINL